MKAFCYTGSNSINSVSAELGVLLQELLKEVNITTNLCKGSNRHIEICKGCTNCFEKGICPLDERDDVANNVCGIMKNYID